MSEGEVEVAADRLGLHLLSDDEAKTRIDLVARAFVTDPERRWWWDSLVEPTKRNSYADSDGLAILEELLESENEVDLFVTDDSGSPWPLISGNSTAVVRLLRECLFFEFIIAARDGSWVIFDTHDNELVLAGRLGR
jgi:hypothetical protein